MKNQKIEATLNLKESFQGTTNWHRRVQLEIYRNTDSIILQMALHRTKT